MPRNHFTLQVLEKKRPDDCDVCVVDFSTGDSLGKNKVVLKPGNYKATYSDKHRVSGYRVVLVAGHINGSGDFVPSDEFGDLGATTSYFDTMRDSGRVLIRFT